MLLLEQYFLIYLLGCFILKDRDIRIIFVFLSFDFLVDSILYYYLNQSYYEYLISITFTEVSCLILLIQFIKDTRIKNLFLFCFIPTILSPLFLLSIDHWITRGDEISDYLFILCLNSARYSNEILLTYVIYTTKNESNKTNFWQVFTACNYLAIFFK